MQCERLSSSCQLLHKLVVKGDGTVQTHTALVHAILRPPASLHVLSASTSVQTVP